MQGRIGIHRVQRKLAEVAASTVYLALDEFLDNEVAVKVDRSGALAQLSAYVRSQFLNEAALVSRPSHPLYRGDPH